MYKLYIDTHSNLINIFIAKENKIIDLRHIESNKSHSINTMPLLDNMLKDNKINIKQLSEIYVVNGPGSFTGVRIGITIAKTMAYMLNIPIKVISSLEILSVSILEDINKVVVLSEKNGKFIGIFDKDNNLKQDYFYLSNKEYETYSFKEKVFEDIKINYDKVLKYVETKKESVSHSINPIYIKGIEVLNGKGSNN